jgi:hypothetical protein
MVQLSLPAGGYPSNLIFKNKYTLQIKGYNLIGTENIGSKIRVRLKQRLDQQSNIQKKKKARAHNHFKLSRNF